MGASKGINMHLKWARVQKQKLSLLIGNPSHWSHWGSTNARLVL